MGGFSFMYQPPTSDFHRDPIVHASIAPLFSWLKANKKMREKNRKIR
jgi:hypothetical protein